MKRFYQLVTYVPHDGEYHIHLDGKAVRTPSGEALAVPGEKLAGMIMQEWANQGEAILPETMPLTQILTTALERSGTDRQVIEKTVLAYLDTDLLCYRTIMPDALALRQAEIWDPFLGWFEQQAGIALETTTTLAALSQKQAAHDYARAVLTAADQWDFTALQMVTASSGSLVLAMAFVAGAASADDVFTAAHLEELYRSVLYNEDFYGRDPHQEKAEAAFLRELNALRLFLETLERD